MVSYHGSCHCKLVRFNVCKAQPITILVDCDCSICRRQGFLHTPVEDDEIEILSGKSKLSSYQFGSKTAKYWFCPHCGCNPFNRSRNNPQRYSVNVRCLDEFDELLASTDIWFVDGRDHPFDRGSLKFQARPNPYRANTGPVPGGIADPMDRG